MWLHRHTSPLCLALIHHVVIGANIPLASFIDWLAALGGELVIEFVGREDDKVCTLLRKPDAQQNPVPVKYVGFDIPAEFVVGYGLDYAEKYRSLPFVGSLSRHVYAPQA